MDKDDHVSDEQLARLFAGSGGPLTDDDAQAVSHLSHCAECVAKAHFVGIDFQNHLEGMRKKLEEKN
ncbi:MAG: hypothetical protein HY918_01950 [Candidatus Doudnabacteria bacterium]|nr:hypothetical protein [Candidatus Doudnabacteria bacterium]